MAETKSASADPMAKFWLGRFNITETARRTIGHEEALMALRRHHDSDWGDVCPADREDNEKALADGGRLVSAYHSAGGVKFWIITEADRDITTVLMPEDY